jgi:hypothetical protein
MYILVILIFISPMETAKDQFHFANKRECERISDMLKSVSKFRTITSCQAVT